MEGKKLYHLRDLIWNPYLHPDIEITGYELREKCDSEKGYSVSEVLGIRIKKEYETTIDRKVSGGTVRMMSCGQQEFSEENCFDLDLFERELRTGMFPTVLYELI